MFLRYTTRKKNGKDRVSKERAMRRRQLKGLWQFYIQRTEVEAAFKSLKDGLSLRPIYHQLGHRMEAHILISIPRRFRWVEPWSTRSGPVAQTSQSAVSRASQPAGRTASPVLPIWKSATQQVWKPALQDGEFH